MASGDDRQSALLTNPYGGGSSDASQGVSAFALPGIKGGHTGGGEVPQVPGHHGEAMLPGRSGDQQVGTVVAQGRRELAPASSTPAAPLPRCTRR